MLVLLLCCASAAGCGGVAREGVGEQAATRARPATAAERVCGRARDAAAGLLGETRVRVTSSLPGELECLLAHDGTRVDVVAQSGPRAWTEFDTTIVHQVQAYGSGSLHVPSQLPRPVEGVGTAAEWIPARQELVALHGTQSAGTYLTVTVERSRAAGPASRRLARAVARATFAALPR